MMARNRKRYFILGIPAAVLGNLDLLLQPKTESGSLTSWFLASTFDVSSMFKQKSLVLTMGHLAMMVLFLFLYGNCFSHDLQGSGIYCLVRKKNRWSWYFSHVFRLFPAAVLYLLCYLGCLYFLCMYHAISGPDKESLTAALAMLLSMAGVLFPAALLSNIIGSVWGDAVGGLGGFLFLAGMVLACLHQNEMALTENHRWMRYLNPAYAMSLYKYGRKQDIFAAMLIWLSEIFILLILGGFLLNCIDIYGNQKEAEG